MSLAQRGFAVVNFTYRLAPESKFPAMLEEDLNLVCKWVMKRAGRFHFDTERIFAVGDSAGAHLLGLYAGICTNPAYAAKYDFTVPEGLPQPLALNCGVYQDPKGERRRPDHADHERASSTGRHRRRTGQISVLTPLQTFIHLLFCMTAVADHQKGQAPASAQKLLENNVPFVYRVFGDKVNSLVVFHCDVKTIDAAQCNDAECDFSKVCF